MHKIFGCLLLWLALSAGDVSAQNTIKGRVVDENGAPVAKIEVLLHRVTKGGGGGVDADTSDATGAFELVAPAETDSSALFFVAVQEGGELFMGEMQRLPFPDTLEYIVEAGNDPVQLSPPPVQPEERRAGYYVILAGVMLVAAVLSYVLRRRPPAHRRLLTRLAILPEDDQSEATARRRRELYARLKRNV